MQVSELLSLVNSLYPNTATVEDKVRYMNIAQNALAPYFSKKVEDDSLETVADQDKYDYPTGLHDIRDILSLAVANQDTPNDRYDYTLYKKNYREDDPKSMYGYYQVIDSTGAKKLVIYPVPDTSFKPIVIRYRKQLQEISSSEMNFEPEFDSRYHEALAFYCCHMICSLGASPDYYQADMFMQKYEYMVSEIWRQDTEENGNTRRRDNPHWRKSRSYSTGE